MIRIVYVRQIIGVAAALIILAFSSTTLNSVDASVQEIQCNPPIQDMDNPNYLVERCSNNIVCDIDPVNKERVRCFDESKNYEDVPLTDIKVVEQPSTQPSTQTSQGLAIVSHQFNHIGEGQGQVVGQISNNGNNPLTEFPDIIIMLEFYDAQGYLVTGAQGLIPGQGTTLKPGETKTFYADVNQDDATLNPAVKYDTIVGPYLQSEETNPFRDQNPFRIQDDDYVAKYDIDGVKVVDDAPVPPASPVS